MFRQTKHQEGPAAAKGPSKEWGIAFCSVVLRVSLPCYLLLAFFSSIFLACACILPSFMDFKGFCEERKPCFFGGFPSFSSALKRQFAKGQRVRVGRFQRFRLLAWPVLPMCLCSFERQATVPVLPSVPRSGSDSSSFQFGSCSILFLREEKLGNVCNRAGPI